MHQGINSKFFLTIIWSIRSGRGPENCMLCTYDFKKLQSWIKQSPRKIPFKGTRSYQHVQNWTFYTKYLCPLKNPCRICRTLLLTRCVGHLSGQNVIVTMGHSRKDPYPCLSPYRQRKFPPSTEGERRNVLRCLKEKRGMLKQIYARGHTL